MIDYGNLRFVLTELVCRRPFASLLTRLAVKGLPLNEVKG
jgi:hypothetical protein